MKNENDQPELLNLFNHLTIDSRMECVSPHGFGPTSFNPLNYVDMCLSPTFAEFVPQEVRDMFDRAKATMSYGVYYYPLFTAGMESIHRLLEAALYHCAFQNGCSLPKKRAMFFDLLEFCKNEGLILKCQFFRWDASRHLRNAASHQKSTSLHFPNTAIHSLQIAKELVEALFVYGPPDLVVFHKRCARQEKEKQEFEAYLNRRDEINAKQT